MEKNLRKFLLPYIGQSGFQTDVVQEDDVDMLVYAALYHHIEQEIIDYGTAHPEAPFWDFLKLIKPPTSDEILAMQREIDSEPDNED